MRGGEVGCLLVPSFIFFHLTPVFLDQWRFCHRQGHVAVSGDSFGCHSWQGVLLVANEWSSETLIDAQDGPHHTELSGLKGGQGQV